MKTIRLLILALLCSVSAFAQSTDIKETGNGTVVGRTAAKKIAFHGSTPVAQRAASAQAEVTKTTGAAVATTAVTQTTPWGFASQAQGDLITTRLNTLIADNAALVTLVNELRAALVEKGLIKGAP